MIHVFHDPHFWTTAALIFFTVIVLWKAGKQLVASMDEKIVAIRHNLDEAQRLRQEAGAILSDYQRQKLDVKVLANRIYTDAQTHIESMQEKMQADVSLAISRGEKALEQKISGLKSGVLNDLKNKAVDQAMDAIETLVSKKSSQDLHNKLLSQAIDDIVAAYQDNPTRH